MLLCVLRSPRGHNHLQKLTFVFARISRFLRQYRLPLLLLLLAAVTEVYFHTSRFSVNQPDHDLDPPFHTQCQEPVTEGPREKAALVMLVRNSELEGAVKTVRSIEKHFNQWFHYPIVFLNDEAWDDVFIETMNATASGEVRFEVLTQEEWSFPSWMDVGKARQGIDQQGKDGILYAGMESYHHMCRFYSGKFYTFDALKEYKWYWRIEPDVDFYCALTYDPFVEMARRSKVYGYTIALPEVPRTCPSLFREMADWKERHRPEIRGSEELWKAMVSPSWVPWPFRRMSLFRHRDRGGDGWNMCHYWSNFEIASLDFFRSKEYQSLFEHLDSTGGFYRERWGDAPVHSLALAMLLDSPQRVHHFADIGYRHDSFFQCPANAFGSKQLPHSDVLSENIPWAPEYASGIGCRCECDGAKTLNVPAYCLNRLKQPNSDRRLSTWAWVRSRYT
ncbi:nucleotide-diphospho-sugar transferase [Apodospora peruviana]|uniref:Nucleotide-diphospho-sugar transferase n=1 Tax=Apodospora peruviana TaxID=516989 RepID=A0AAE0M208_9PEZI|nr:nucleotide-diphospho-sugar transferase [Apodospora peruviana]